MGLEQKEGAAADMLRAILMGQQQNPQVAQIEALGQMNQAQLQQLLPVIAGDNKLMRTPSGFDRPAPNNLDIFYQNNPNVARGEFDPTGELALERGRVKQQGIDSASQGQTTENQIRENVLQTIFGSLQFPEGGSSNPETPTPVAQPQLGPELGPGNFEGLLEAFQQPQVPNGGVAHPSRVAPLTGQGGGPTAQDPFSQEAIDAESLDGAAVNPARPAPQSVPAQSPIDYQQFFGNNPALESLNGQPSPANALDYLGVAQGVVQGQRTPFEGLNTIRGLNQQNANNLMDVGAKQADLIKSTLMSALGGPTSAAFGAQRHYQQGKQNLLDLFR